MNAALRSVVRSANYHGIECVGYYRGYQGIIENDFKSLEIVQLVIFLNLVELF